jgi:hypothetical protein
VSDAVASLFDDLFVVPDEPISESPVREINLEELTAPTAAPAKDTKVFELSLDELMNMDD